MLRWKKIYNRKFFDILIFNIVAQLDSLTIIFRLIVNIQVTLNDMIYNVLVSSDEYTTPSKQSQNIKLVYSQPTFGVIDRVD